LAAKAIIIVYHTTRLSVDRETGIAGELFQEPLKTI
jgi:hypothetical protein